jgi:hypothetical protein
MFEVRRRKIGHDIERQKFKTRNALGVRQKAQGVGKKYEIRK